jgi:hypothetical protein
MAVRVRIISRLHWEFLRFFLIKSEAWLTSETTAGAIWLILNISMANASLRELVVVALDDGILS